MCVFSMHSAPRCRKLTFFTSNPNLLCRNSCRDYSFHQLQSVEFFLPKCDHFHHLESIKEIFIKYHRFQTFGIKNKFSLSAPKIPKKKNNQTWQNFHSRPHTELILVTNDSSAKTFARRRQTRVRMIANVLSPIYIYCNNK